MTVDVASLDAHEQPSETLRAIWKGFSKADPEETARSGSIDDLEDPEKAAEFKLLHSIPSATLARAFNDFVQDEHCPVRVDGDAPVYYHPILPGLLIIPSLVPPAVQKVLLSRLIHRDLSDAKHTTNMHLHFNLPYPEPPASFFSYPPDSPVEFEPKNEAAHRPLSVKQVLNRKLHWVTLGGQYDWTNRVYPGEEPPRFPRDVASLLESLFPETQAQAAIVNFYTPGDSMMMHRDVSEETDKGLISLSIGCDGLFMISPSDIGNIPEEERAATEKHYLLLRLRSGDAIYMTEESRFAWHGVPKVVKGTCPDYLADWPAGDGQYEDWKGWLSNKRINLNVRQIRD